MLEDLPQPQHESAFGLSLDGILLVHAVLETHQLLQQLRDAGVHLLTQHLAAVTERRCPLTAALSGGPCEERPTRQSWADGPDSTSSPAPDPRDEASAPTARHMPRGSYGPQKPHWSVP